MFRSLWLGRVPLSSAPQGVGPGVPMFLLSELGVSIHMSSALLPLPAEKFASFRQKNQEKFSPGGNCLNPAPCIDSTHPGFKLGS